MVVRYRGRVNKLAAPLAFACLLAPAVAWADVPPGPPPEPDPPAPEPEPTPEPAPEPTPDAKEEPKTEEAKKDDAKKDEKAEEKKGCSVDHSAGPEGLLALGILVLGGLALRRRR